MSRVTPRLGFIAPQLPSLTDQPPEGAGWIHEVKHDGYRTLLVIERGKARAALATVTIGATAIPSLSTRPPLYPAVLQSSTER